MSKEMRYVEFSLTPHNTCRVFVHKGMIEENEQFHLLMDTLCIWGGPDWYDETHKSWEFDLKYADDMKKYAELHNRTFEYGHCEWDV